MLKTDDNIVASELKDPICHSNECQIGSFSSEATIHSFISKKLTLNYGYAERDWIMCVNYTAIQMKALIIVDN